jgi:hypothetical protein
MLARKITLLKHFVGAPKLTDFKIVEETLAPLQDGGEAVMLLLFDLHATNN